jgi:tetratricopeptide (TPR) repeat protein
MANQSDGLTQLAELARENWHTRYALLLAVILSLGLTSSVLLVIKPDTLIKTVVYLVVGVATCAFWWRSNRLPKTRRDKVGFVISISTGDEVEHKKIMEDFVLTLHELVKRGASGRSFQLIRVPKHVAEKIVDQDDAEELRVKCRAHFLIYGRVRLRSIGGKQQHLLHLEGQVAHKPLPKAVGERFAKEFSELLPRRLQFATENDVFSFAFTSEWVDCVAKYIIGIAAALSGDLDYAEVLQEDVRRLLEGQDRRFPVFAKLKQRVPIRLAEINQARASMALRRWGKTHDPAEIAEMGLYLGRIPLLQTNTYSLLLLRSVFLFLGHRDVKGAMSILRKCKGVSDGTWLYDLGFLHAYTGELKKALQRYRSAMRLPIDPSVISEMEEFLCWILEVEPDKYQFHFCLGFINLEIKGDKEQAIKDLEIFLSRGNEHEFAEERRLARTWISEISGVAREEGSGRGST